jgi:hypothetical protein
LRHPRPTIRRLSCSCESSRCAGHPLSRRPTQLQATL